MKKVLIYILFILMSIEPLHAGARSLSLFADLLAWKASEETTSTWLSKITIPNNNQARFSPEDIAFNPNIGVRGGLLYEPETHFWDIKLYWTYFSTKTNSNFSPGAQIVVPEFFSGFLSGDIFFGASVEWKLLMNTIDLETGHNFKIAHSLTIRPSIGIKGGIINQTINSQWDAVIYTSTEKLQNDFYGAGPSFGIASKWNIVGSLNLVGNFSTAFMWGNWNVNDTYIRPSALFGIVTPTTITTSMKHSVLGTLMLDYILGFEWVHPRNLPLRFILGYEMQFWANQLRLTTFQQLPLHGDLTFQGVTCGLEIDL